VRERHQRPRVGDLGTKWKIFYWDYSSGSRRGRTKSWARAWLPPELKRNVWLISLWRPQTDGITNLNFSPPGKKQWQV
jgi:hypothetical protein